VGRQGDWNPVWGEGSLIFRLFLRGAANSSGGKSGAGGVFGDRQGFSVWPDVRVANGKNGTQKWGGGTYFARTTQPADHFGPAGHSRRQTMAGDGTNRHGRTSMGPETQAPTHHSSFSTFGPPPIPGDRIKKPAMSQGAKPRASASSAKTEKRYRAIRPGPGRCITPARRGPRNGKPRSSQFRHLSFQNPFSITPLQRGMIRGTNQDHFLSATWAPMSVSSPSRRGAGGDCTVVCFGIRSPGVGARQAQTDAPSQTFGCRVWTPGQNCTFGIESTVSGRVERGGGGAVTESWGAPSTRDQPTGLGPPFLG